MVKKQFSQPIQNLAAENREATTAESESSSEEENNEDELDIEK